MLLKLNLTVETGAPGDRVDVTLTSPPAASMAEVEAAISAALVGNGSSPGLFLGSERLATNEPLSATAVRDGSIVGLGTPVREASETGADGLMVTVVSGVEAGARFALTLGVNTIGREATTIVLQDPAVSRRHAVVRITPEGLFVEDTGSSNGTWLDEVQIKAPSAWPEGTTLRVGTTTLLWSGHTASLAHTQPSGDGGLVYNRPPRLLPATPAVKIEFPARPTERDKTTLPMATIVAPLILGVVMAYLQHRWEFLLFTLLSPVLMLTNFVTDRRRGARSMRGKWRAYEEVLDGAQRRLSVELAAEQHRRRMAHPGPYEVLITAALPTQRLWERRARDPDAMVVRIGTADLDTQVEVAVPMGEPIAERPVVRTVPVTVALRDVGVLGIAGPRAAAQALARSVVGQVATWHSPHAVRIVVFTNKTEVACWGWLRWLPHCRPLEGQACSVLIGNDEDTVAARAAELLALITAREKSSDEPRKHGMVFGDVLAVLDGARELRSAPGIIQVLRDGPAVGVMSVCIEDSDRMLPEECHAVAAFEATSTTQLTVSSSGKGRITNVTADSVTPQWAEELARSLAPLRDVSREEEDAGLPDASRLLDVINLEPPTPVAIEARWMLSDRSTQFTVGVDANGPYTLDLRRDGPHVLVAGTTGAGKSELLQTVIASLAVANRPDMLNFVLIDYKGGSAFKDCARLPHTVGMVTDLDGHLTERALASLTAELKRREHLLKLAGVKDIDDYWDALDRREGKALPPMPRLLLIVDEFASLARELPEFITGLVGVAQLGRALGVHMVLATQRPGGVVTPEIRANTNLRIALRVTDAGESSDVIDAPDASRIPQSLPGRGYARTGYSQLTAFQTARIGGRRPEADEDIEAPTVQLLPWGQLGRRQLASRQTARSVEAATDLSVLVDAIRVASEQSGAVQMPSPWLPALDAHLLVSDITLPVPAGGDVVPVIPFGLEDVPDRQLQRPITLDLARGGHLLICGSPRSGRSTALRTIAGVIGARTSVRDVHMYALDCGNGALLPLAKLPHCGAVVMRDQVDRADRLIARLLGEVARRQQLLSNLGFAGIGEQRAAANADDRLPYVVVLLDRWEGFIAAFEDLDAGRMVADVLRLLREGLSAGVHVVITGDRAVLTGRVGSAIEDRIVLRLSDRSDYGLANLNARNLPSNIPPGRAFRADSGRELQIGLLAGDVSESGQAASLQAVADAASQRELELPKTLRPGPVGVLPKKVALTNVDRDLEWTRPAAPLWTMLGVGGDDLMPMGIDLDTDGPGLLIAGPPRSGRSTALYIAALSLLDGGAKLLVLTPRRSPLRELHGRPGVIDVLEGDGVTGDDLLTRVDGDPNPIALCIDDGELLNDGPADATLQRLLREARDHSRAIIVAGTTTELGGYRGFISDVRKSKAGLLLCPATISDGDLLGIRLARSGLFATPRGRGMMVVRGAASLIQVPIPGA